MVFQLGPYKWRIFYTLRNELSLFSINPFHGSSKNSTCIFEMGRFIPCFVLQSFMWLSIYCQSILILYGKLSLFLAFVLGPLVRTSTLVMVVLTRGPNGRFSDGFEIAVLILP